MDYSNNSRAKALGGEKGLKTTVGWEIAMATYNARQKWYYLSDMDVEEALLMRIFDSDLVGGLDEGRVAVHASFEDPAAKDEGARESIEFRCLVFWEDQPLKVQIIPVLDTALPLKPMFTIWLDFLEAEDALLSLLTSTSGAQCWNVQ